MAMSWTLLKTFELGEGGFGSPWQMALDFIEDVNLLKLAAEGEWEALPGISPLCGPDGLAGLAPANDALILPGFRIGTLIGKVGGSSAGVEAVAAEGETPAAPDAFAIGTGCLVPIVEGRRGPLFISFNSRTRPLAVKRLKLEIWGTTIAS
jgi:hypothetical protein